MTLFDHPDFDHHEGVYAFSDRASGLRAFVALHSTVRGPAAGGCRLWRYDNEQDALTDVLRLSRGMSYKNALAGLPVGGGKAVILAPEGDFDRAALFQAFGRAVQSLCGAYVTAEDVGTTGADLCEAGKATSFIAGRPRDGGEASDPSPYTALGVFHSIETALSIQGRTLAGASVAIQGLGAVGWALATRLANAGARLVVSDIVAGRCSAAEAQLGAQVAPTHAIHAWPADVFAPCALGGVLNARTIPELAASIVCGAANNQLEERADAERLRLASVLYCPDYLVNAGGIIAVMAAWAGDDEDTILARVRQIGSRLAAVIRLASNDDTSPAVVADCLAATELSAKPSAFARLAR